MAAANGNAALTIRRVNVRGAIVFVAGKAPPNADIIVWDSLASQNNKSRQPSFQSRRIIDRVRSDHTGAFYGKGILADGVHLVWVASPNCIDDRCVATWKNRVSVNASAPPPGPFRTTRSLTLDVRFQQLRAEIAVKLPRTDPYALAVLQNGANLPDFIERFYPIDIKGSVPRDLRTLFANAVPKVTVDEDSIAITADSEYQHPGVDVIPAWADSIRLVPRDRPGRRRGDLWWTDTLRIDVEDYQGANPRPLPVQEAGSSFIWEHPYDPEASAAGLDLRYAPLSSIDAFRRGLQSSPFVFFPNIVARFLALSHGLLYALPMLAYVLLAGARSPLIRAARVLTAVAVSADVFLIFQSSQPDVNKELETGLRFLKLVPPIDKPLITQLLAPLVMAVVLWAITVGVAIVARIIGGPLRRLSREIALAVRGATGAFAALVVLQWLMAPLAAVPSLYLALTSGVLAAATLLVLWRAGFFLLPREGRNRTTFFVATMLVVGLIALPLTLTQYQVWTQKLVATLLDATAFAHATGLLALATSYAQTFLLVAPAVFGVMLMLSLRSGVEQSGLTLLQLGNILFSCYAVDISGMIVIVPIAFAIAWPGYRLIVRRAPVPPRIRENRERLIAEVLTAVETSTVSEKLCELQGKYVDGSLSEEEFEAAKQRALGLMAAPASTDSAYVLGVTMEDDPWRAGEAILPIAVTFAVLHAVVALAFGVPLLKSLHPAFYAFTIVSLLLVAAMPFVVGGFAFGACYDLLVGPSGTRKALAVGCWVALFSSPSWLLKVNALPTLASLAVEVLLFYTMIGLIMDVRIVRQTMGHLVHLTDIARLTGVAALSWSGGIATAALGVAVSGLLSGSLQSGLAQVVDAVFKQALSGFP